MQNGVIYGIDIAKGSSRAQNIPRYAVAVLRNNEIEHHKMLHMHKVLRMLQKDRPDYIAVDNIYELAPDKHELIQFLSKLPENTRLVQVTGGVNQQSLLRLAGEHGISFDPSDPGEEAEVCAILANLGVGCEVSLFEDMTKIKISRARSLGRGGWSQNRYRRKVHGGVKEKNREIESILRKFSRDTGLTYSLKVTEGFGGYVRAEYTVNARRDRVPIKPSITADVQVTVKSVEREKIKFLPIKRPGRRYTIVGVDPGTTVGIAIFSLEGELLLARSIRGISHDEVVRLIAEYGKPAIIATDVTPVPAAVEKVRRSFNAVLGSPGGELRAEDKIALARPFNYSNDHERDALAAALVTYKNYKNIFSRVEKKAPGYMDLEKVKYHVIHGASIEEAIEKMQPSPKLYKTVWPGQEKADDIGTDERISRLREELSKKNARIKQMDEYLKELRYESGQKKKEIDALNLRINKMRGAESQRARRDKEIQIRDNEIDRLKKELAGVRNKLTEQSSYIKRLKMMHRTEMKGEGVPVKLIRSFTKEAIQQTKDTYTLRKGDLVYLDKASGGGPVTASILVEAGIRAVITSEELPHAALEYFYDSNLPVVKGLEVQQMDDFVLVDPVKLEVAIGEWNDKVRVRQKEKEHQQFKIMLDEYRSQRRRGLA